MRKRKRLSGLAVVTLGAAVVSVMLVWLAVYFVSRGAGPDALRASLGSELGYWLPVLLLSLPGLLLIFHGKRMMRDERISLLEFVEVLGLLVMVIVVYFVATR